MFTIRDLGFNDNQLSVLNDLHIHTIDAFASRAYDESSDNLRRYLNIDEVSWNYIINVCKKYVLIQPKIIRAFGALIPK